MRSISARWSATTSRGKGVDRRLLAGARVCEQLIHHDQGTSVMLDHAFEKEPVEFAPGGRLEASHLLCVEHARHHHSPSPFLGRGHARTASLKPPFHHADLVLLRQIDALCQQPYALVLAAPGHQGGHLQGLCMMVDHPLHEANVGVGVLHAR